MREGDKILKLSGTITKPVIRIAERQKCDPGQVSQALLHFAATFVSENLNTVARGRFSEDELDAMVNRLMTKFNEAIYAEAKATGIPLRIMDYGEETRKPSKPHEGN